MGSAIIKQDKMTEEEGKQKRVNMERRKVGTKERRHNRPNYSSGLLPSPGVATPRSGKL